MAYYLSPCAYTLCACVQSIFKDAPEPWQLGFQDAASPVMEEIIFFHDQIMFILIIIITIVFWMIARVLTTKRYNKYLFEGTLIEII